MSFANSEISVNGIISQKAFSTYKQTLKADGTIDRPTLQTMMLGQGVRYGDKSHYENFFCEMRGESKVNAFLMNAAPGSVVQIKGTPRMRTRKDVNGNTVWHFWIDVKSFTMLEKRVPKQVQDQQQSNGEPEPTPPTQMNQAQSDLDNLSNEELAAKMKEAGNAV